MNNSLVEVNNQIVTDSRKVAEVFGKEHGKVIRSIEGIITQAKNGLSGIFYEATYKDGSGKSNKMYLMNRDGFSLLVMGFNGKKALEWKLKYIEAFNEMEKQLNVPKLAPNPHYRTRLIKTAVRDIGGTAEAIADVFGVKKGMATAAAMKMVGEAYGIDTEPLRSLLPAEATPGLLTPTAIAKALDIVTGKGTPDPSAVNLKLEELGLQARVNKQWTLTDAGKAYGENKPFTRNGHSGYVINWHESVLEVLRQADAYLTEKRCQNGE